MTSAGIFCFSVSFCFSWPRRLSRLLFNPTPDAALAHESTKENTIRGAGVGKERRKRQTTGNHLTSPRNLTAQRQAEPGGYRKDFVASDVEVGYQVVAAGLGNVWTRPCIAAPYYQPSEATNSFPFLLFVWLVGARYALSRLLAVSRFAGLWVDITL